MDINTEPDEYMGQKLEYGFQTYPGWAMLAPKLKEEPVKWKIPSILHIRTESLISEQVAKNLILVKNGRNIVVSNTDTKKIAWYYKYSSSKIPRFALANNEKVIVYEDRKDTLKVSAINTLSGKRLWSAIVKIPKNSTKRWLYNEQGNSLLVIGKNTNGITIAALDWDTGKKKWDKFHRFEKISPSNLFITDEMIVCFSENSMGISLRNGEEIWQNNQVGWRNQIEQDISTETFYLIDNNNKLCWLNGNTGKFSARVSLPDSPSHSGIYASGNFVYIRGTIKEKKEPDKYTLYAFNNSNNESIWSYTDTIMGISNIIDTEKLVYFSTWQDIIALDKKTGKVRFKTRVTEVGKNFPVTLHKFENKLVFVGELNIVHVDATSGEIILTKGFDPLSQSMNLTALDSLCEVHYKYLKRFGKVGLGENAAKDFSGGFNYTLAYKSQEQANSLHKSSREYYRRFKKTGNESYYYKSERLRLQSMVESSFAKSWSVVQSFDAIFNLAVQSTDKYIKKDRDRYEMLLKKRESLMKIYDKQLVDEFVVKEIGDDKKKENGSKVIVVHLPSGKTVLSREKGRLGGNFVYDPFKKELYFHDFRLVPELEKLTENENGKAAHGFYLAGVPIK